MVEHDAKRPLVPVGWGIRRCIEDAPQTLQSAGTHVEGVAFAVKVTLPVSIAKEGCNRMELAVQFHALDVPAAVSCVILIHDKVSSLPLQQREAVNGIALPFNRLPQGSSG